MPSLGALSTTQPHRSFFRERLQRCAQGAPLEDWLVEEANVRGQFGAVGASIPDRKEDGSISTIDLIVALLMPHAPVDGRVFKLVVRMLQRFPVDSRLLWLAARREQADRALFWLLHQIPIVEQVGSIPGLMAVAQAPRGYRALRFRYDGARLLRRPATKESVWKAAQR